MSYRCYLTNNGKIETVEALDVATDEQAVREAEQVFRGRSEQFSGFEVWQLARFVHRFPPSEE